MAVELIGQILLRRTPLTEAELDDALGAQQEGHGGERLGQILVERGLVTQQEVLQAFAEQWGIPYLERIPQEQLTHDLVRDLPFEFLLKHALVPFLDGDETVGVAMADPLDVRAFDAVANAVKRPCARVACPAPAVEEALSHCYYQGGGEDQLERAQADELVGDISSITQAEDLMDLAQRAPIIRLVNTILFQAARSRASDIHVEPYEHEVKVRFRIDGVLHHRFSQPKQFAAALVSRLKVMAHLDIAERRLPQDGRTGVKIGDKEIDIRVSTIPTSGGERVVLRLLDKAAGRFSLQEIGFAPDTERRFRPLIRMSHGIVLLTGPTGSGKTTTLYAALSEINSEELNILTVEDPIEYQLPGVGQMQVQPKIDLTFANSLRNILRQDPDVIMVGEIRDLETAEIAIRAALTGHLVFSTLHTNDSASAITRLLDMGIEPYLVSSSVVAIMAQRLVRVVCPECKEPYSPSPEVLHLLGGDALRPGGQPHRGRGCSNCINTGYRGRTGLFELLLVDDEIRELITTRVAANLIKQGAVSAGMRTLRDDGIQKALAGETTVEEVIRVSQDDILQYVE
jgi:general secretion pathway protein E